LQADTGLGAGELDPALAAGEGIGHRYGRLGRDQRVRRVIDQHRALEAGNVQADVAVDNGRLGAGQIEAEREAGDVERGAAQQAPPGRRRRPDRIALRASPAA
jgi:hypothetical protein